MANEPGIASGRISLWSGRALTRVGERVSLVVLLLFTCGAVTACLLPGVKEAATRPVLISSEPPGATIATSDGRMLGTTPLTVQAYDTLPPHWLWDGVLTQGRIAARKQGCTEQTRALGEFNVPDEISFQLDCSVTSTSKVASAPFAQAKADGPPLGLHFCQKIPNDGVSVAWFELLEGWKYRVDDTVGDYRYDPVTGSIKWMGGFFADSPSAQYMPLKPEVYNFKLPWKLPGSVSPVVLWCKYLE